MSEPEYNLPVQVINSEAERFEAGKKSKSSEFTYHKKEYPNTDTSAYDRVLNSHNKLDTLYNTTMPIIYKPVIEGKYEVTGYTRFVPIVVEQEEDGIQWACNTSISVDTG